MNDPKVSPRAQPLRPRAGAGAAAEFAALLRAAPVAVYRCARDEEGEVLLHRIEGGLAEHLGLRSAALRGRPLDEALPAAMARAVAPAIERAFAGEDAEIKHAWDARVLHHELEPLLDAEGRVAGVRGVVTDVTEVERAHDGLQVFAAAVSNDLRAPLTVARNYNAIVRRRYGEKLGDDGRAHLRKMEDALERMSGVMEDLLRLTEASRLDLDVREVPIGAIVAEAAKALREREPQASVRVEVDELGVAHGDERLVRVLVEKLLAHAWRGAARHKGALIEFSVEPVDDTIACFLTVAAPGVTPDDAARLFRREDALLDPAETGAVGISLAIIDTVVRRHGGRFWTSPAEGGAAFCFTLAPEWYAYA